MEKLNTTFDGDEILSAFLSDYADGNLNKAERTSFEEYLSQNEEERKFAKKVVQGKKALNRLAEAYQLSTVQDI